MKNKPYDKAKNTSSLGSDLTTVIQNFHYSGDSIEEKEERKNIKNSNA